MATAVLYNLQPNLALANGTIETYEADGTTPQATYKDNQQISPHDTTIQLDTYGLPPGGSMWLGSNLTYKLIFKDYTGTVIYAVNNVEPGGNTFTAGIQLGGNLDVNGNLITSNPSSPDINITPYGSGKTYIQNLIVNGISVDSDVDMNGYNLIMDSLTGIKDDSMNELLMFNKTASAVNYLDITNTATGTGPLLAAKGDDTNIDLRLDAKGTGRIKTLDGLDVTGTATISSTLTVGSLDSTGDVAGNTLTAKSGGGVKFNKTDNAFAITLNPPSGLSANYTMTLPGSNASGTLNNNGSGVLTYGEPTLSNLSGAIYTTNVIQTRQGIGLRNSSNGNVITLNTGITTSGYNVTYPTSLKSNFTQVHDVNGQVFVQVPVVVGSVSETGVTTGSLTLAQSHLNSGAQFRTYYIDLTARAGILDSSTNLRISFPTGDIYDWVLDYFNGSAWTRDTSAGRIAVGISGGGTLTYVQGQCKARIMIPCIKDGSVYRMYYGMTVTGNWMDVNGTTHTFQAGCRRVATTANPTLNSHYPAFTGLQLQPGGGTCAWDAVVTVVESN